MTLSGNILLTGGAGYLGRAIVRRATRSGWPCTFTILSRDAHKHQLMRLEFPNCRYVLGDVADYDSVYKAIVGHDLVIHAAAMKHIVDAEWNVEETIKTNVTGSINVARACVEASVKRCVGISTDKACHPVNVYGASKMQMERIFQEYNRRGITGFNLCRYGNVLASTGSVITDWQRKLKDNPNRIETTSDEMSRFWLSVEQAVDIILIALSEPAGTIAIPKLKAASMGALESWYIPKGVEIAHKGLRPGEKIHEELLTEEESPFAMDNGAHYTLWPSTTHAIRKTIEHYSSDNAPQLTRDEFEALLK